jgi:regulatory protein
VAEPDPVELAARALRHRDRSREEIDGRLRRAGVAAAARADALDTLERVGYVDDERFAVGRAAALAGRGYGDAAIRDDIEGRGVEDATIAAALEELEREVERARALVGRLGSFPQTANRLARKGFAEESIEAAAGRIAETGESAVECDD